MIKTLKLENGRWNEIVPFDFYLTPLKDALTKVRNELLDMEKAGPLLCKYIIEQNTQLQDLTKTMVQRDQIA